MHTFTATDRAGKPHEYKVEPHPGIAGAELALRISALATEPVIETLRTLATSPAAQKLASALKEGTPDGTDTADLLAEVGGDLLSSLRDLDLSTLGRSLAAALDRKDGVDLVKRVLARTYRDGKALGDAMHLDTAYQANYGELIRALVEVIRFNGFFPLVELFESGASEPAPVVPIPSAGAPRRSTRNAG